MIQNDYLWVSKYRPRTIEDTILPDSIKQSFASFVKKKQVPNLLLNGGPGVGKTTAAKALVEECGYDCVIINGSLHGNIDTLRTDIMNFASTISFSNNKKFVILDEADHLNPQSTQPALRNFMEEYSKNCGFILTCNYKNKIIEPLQSRCSAIDFSMTNKEKAQCASQFMKRAGEILNNENVTYDKATLAEFISKHMPDWRRVLNELQRYSATGSIDTGILVKKSDEVFNELIEYLKTRNFKSVRKWVGINSDFDQTELYRKLYDTSSTHIADKSMPQLIMHLADYSYKAAFCADAEINLMACLTEIMADMEWK